MHEGCRNLGSASSLSWHPHLPSGQAADGHAPRTTCLPHPEPSTSWIGNGCREIFAMRPNLMWGTKLTAFGSFTRDTAGSNIDRSSSYWNADVRSTGIICKRGDPLRRLLAIPWGLRGCMPRPPPVRRGGWLARTPSPARSVWTTSSTRSTYGASGRHAISQPTDQRPLRGSTLRSRISIIFGSSIYRNVAERGEDAVADCRLSTMSRRHRGEAPRPDASLTASLQILSVTHRDAHTSGTCRMTTNLCRKEPGAIDIYPIFKPDTP